MPSFQNRYELVILFLSMHTMKLFLIAQNQMVKKIITRGKTVIDCLIVELAKIRNQHNHTYDDNKDTFLEKLLL